MVGPAGDTKPYLQSLPPSFEIPTTAVFFTEHLRTTASDDCVTKLLLMHNRKDYFQYLFSQIICFFFKKAAEKNNALKE